MTNLKKFLKKFLPDDLILYFWHYPRSFLAALLFGFPARKLTVISVAGTKGKTTTCYLIARILEAAGRKTAMFSTAGLKIGSEEKPNLIKMTTPSPSFLQKFIKKAVEDGCKYLVLETSSHALIQHRTFGIPLKVAVLTNLMSDHLEYHKTTEDYQLSHKKMISPHLQFLVLNNDNPDLKYFLEKPILNGQKITYGLNSSATIFAQDLSLSSAGSSFLIKTPKESAKINLPLLGKYNIYNALAAASVAFYQGVDLLTIKTALEKFQGAPGRTQEINRGQNFKVIVDYAYSADALNNLFGAIIPFKQGKIIAVFGAGGERDRPKPEMGRILDQNADYVVITNDSPRGEDEEKIAQGLISGIKNKIINQNLFKILDRRLAIEKAISLAKKNDLVLILGMGAEQWQIFKDKKIPWDDRKVAAEILEKIKK